MATQTTDNRPVVGYFTPTKEFTCEDTGSVYMKGQKYALRQGNDALAKRVAKWRKQKKVEP